MTRKILAIPLIIFALTISSLAVSRYFVMPWENTDLPKMEKPRILIKKEARTLEVFDGDKLIVSYKVSLGFEPKGDKQIEGDGKTPEGEFYIFTKNPKSKFYLSLGISYPGIDDAKRGLETNVITRDEHDEIVAAISEKRMPPQDTALGGEIYIHGSGNDSDWTAGCIALKNIDMKELFDSIESKTPVAIEP